MSRVHESHENVCTLLKDNSELINSDKLLIIEYLQTYCDAFIPFSLRAKILGKDTPSFESITRSRRKYQEANNIESISRVERQRWEEEILMRDYHGKGR